MQVEKTRAALPRPEVAGPWASIVRDYREKTEVRSLCMSLLCLKNEDTCDRC